MNSADLNTKIDSLNVSHFDGALDLVNLDEVEISIIESSDDLEIIAAELTTYFKENDKIEYLVN
jgi:hypothetical protein